MAAVLGDDAQLLARIEAGDDRALGAVYERHIGVLFGIARRVTGDEHAARDVCQEVFAYLWELPGRVDLTKGSLRAYLVMLAHRRAVDEVRRGVRRARTERALAIPEQFAGPEGAVTDAAAGRWRDEQVRALVDALPEEQRTALRLAYYDGLTYRQVATRLGIAEGTAKSRLRLALARLRDGLGADFRAAI